MAARNGTVHGTAFTVSIEAARGVTTGISAADRARTVQAAVARDARPTDLVQPGHIFPLQAQDGGVLMRAGHTEAGCDLAGMAGLTPATVICEIMNDDGSMARLPDLERFAERHGLKIGTIADLIAFRSHSESLIERSGERELVTPYGNFRCLTYRDRGRGSAPRVVPRPLADHRRGAGARARAVHGAGPARRGGGRTLMAFGAGACKRCSAAPAASPCC